MRMKMRGTYNPTLRTAVWNTQVHLGHDRNQRMSVKRGWHKVKKKRPHTSALNNILCFTFESEHMQSDTGDAAAPWYHCVAADKHKTTSLLHLEQLCSSNLMGAINKENPQTNSTLLWPQVLEVHLWTCSDWSGLRFSPAEPLAATKWWLKFQKYLCSCLNQKNLK